MAEAVVSHALGTLWVLLLEEAKFLYGVSSEVKGLVTQLKEMQCLLKDVDRRQHESNSVQNWISQIRNLAYRAEDVIETYAAEVSSRTGSGFIKLLTRVFCALCEYFTLHQIRLEISEIKSEIARVTKSMQDYGIRSIIQGENSATAGEDRRLKIQTYPFEIDDCFMGKEDDLKRLVSLIVDNKEHQIIALWGMGGLGKTTMARKVYNHVEIKRSFESSAWVCVTQKCQIRSIFDEVFRQLIPQKREEIGQLTTGQLIEQLREIQKDKRCMIVLDDLWEIDHWESLKHAFLVAGGNSKILLTTRKENIANVGLSYKLQLLNEDDGLELLKKKAFPQNIIPDFVVEETWLQKIGKEMVNKCGYLPLAISLLGGVLRSKTSVNEWESVNRNINAYLYRGEGTQEVHKVHGVVDVSYEDLPSHLKPCFLYMGCLREDECIDVYDVYMLWIAQGMVSNENQGREETLMDVAESYLSELASRCLVQVEVDNVMPGARRYSTCQLHDVVLELCLSKGEKEDFRLKAIDHQGGNFSILDLSRETRHLTIQFRRGEEKIKIHSGTHKGTGLQLRSLRLLNQRSRIEFQENTIVFQKLKMLRTLVFEDFCFEGRLLPKEIGNLIHLRYLVLRDCELDELPKSIINLTYLYALDLSGCRNVRLPNVWKKLLRLKHLILPTYDEEIVGKYQLRLDGLNELEMLLGFNSLVHDVKSVSKMKNLRYLGATLHDNESLSLIIDIINTNCHYLCFCRLEIRGGCEFTSSEEGSAILKKLLLTCSNLDGLSIYVPIRKLPEECRTHLSFPNLVTLYLEECEIEDDPMEILEKLPRLQELHLWERSYVGEEMICHAMGFPQLRYLFLRKLPKLREWRVEEGAMPLLSNLTIGLCPELEMIPDGLRFIATLQQVYVCGMPELGKRVSISVGDGGQEGADFDKVRHVPSVIVH